MHYMDMGMGIGMMGMNRMMSMGHHFGVFTMLKRILQHRAAGLVSVLLLLRTVIRHISPASLFLSKPITPLSSADGLVIISLGVVFHAPCYDNYFVC